MSYRIRRCTGFSPSRASGRARETMTDMAYSRKERSISVWISIGSIPLGGSPGGSLPSSPGGRVMSLIAVPSDVQESGVEGVGRYEVLALFDVVAHQDAARLVGEGRLLDVHPQQRPLHLVHGGGAELAPVHLPEALEAVELALVIGPLEQKGAAGGFVL